MSQTTVSTRKQTVRKILKWVLAVLLVLALLLGGFLLWLWCYHPNFIYEPRTYEGANETQTIASFKLENNPKPFDLKSKDGTRVRAYWFENPSKGKKILPVMLYLHGSMGCLEANFKHVSEIMKVNQVNILFVSYRGYGFSEGKPSMGGIRMDSQAALDHLLQSKEVDPTRIMVYGHSLGGAVALHLVADNSHRIHSFIVENTFLSIPKMASHARPYLAWASFVVTEKWDNEYQLERLRLATGRFPKMMMISGEKDTIVPPIHMTNLWNKASKIWDEKKQLRVRAHYIGCEHACSSEVEYYKDFTKFYKSIEIHQL